MTAMSNKKYQKLKCPQHKCWYKTTRTKMSGTENSATKMSENFHKLKWLVLIYWYHWNFLTFLDSFPESGILTFLNSNHFTDIFELESFYWHFWTRLIFLTFLKPDHFYDIFELGSFFWYLWTRLDHPSFTYVFATWILCRFLNFSSSK